LEHSEQELAKLAPRLWYLLPPYGQDANLMFSKDLVMVVISVTARRISAGGCYQTL
jgi:hypothetical protein